MSVYTGLSRAQLSYDYLHTNSTTHEFLFGALAELVDNARDASATMINVYSTPYENSRGGFLLHFLDDGEGMDGQEASDIITFGKSSKRKTDSQLIGMYGNGLKSGSMRIGNDLILFTKKGPVMSCVFLSRTFHEEEKIDEIIVPMPQFDSTNKKPLAKSPEELEKHKIEMELILKYSPFNTEIEFMKCFDKINSISGTLVVIYNLKLLDDGQPELDVCTDSNDIILTNPETTDFNSDEGLMPERRSFRAYTSLLYSDPRMRIYIQNKKVQTKRLVHCLYKPRLYKYASSRFKSRAENESKKAQDIANSAENKAKEAESKARNLENKYGDEGTKDQRTELRKAQTIALDLRKDAQIKKQIAERRVKSLKDPKVLNIIFGININNRSQSGMFVFNCSRLIKMYEKVGPQVDGGAYCSGVVGIVDVPYLVLEPTHNKQDFADAKEYRYLQKAIGEHMIQYWRDIGIAQQGVTKFWEDFGYISDNWKDPPVDDAKYLRKRAMQLQTTIQCDTCLKWRMLPYAVSSIGKIYADNWTCLNNTDPQHNRCSTAEQKLNIPEGLLKKEIKTHEQKQKELEEAIRKKQEELEKIQKNKTVTSSKQVKEMDKKRKDSSDEDEDEEEEEEVRSRKSSRTTRQPEKKEEKPKPVIKPSLVKDPPVRDSRSRAPPPKKPVVVNNRATPSNKRIKKRPVSESEEDDDEDEEDEDEAEDASPSPPPPKKKTQPPPTTTKSPIKPTKAPATPSTIPKAEKRRQSLSDDSEIETKRPAGSNRKPILGSPFGNESSVKQEPDDGMASPATMNGSQMGIGSKVEVKISSSWYKGQITQWNKTSGKWKIKFDEKDKSERWYDTTSHDVRVFKEEEQSNEPYGISSEHVEIPSSSTASVGSQLSQYEDIASGYRTCLRYFLPPNWVMDKDHVSQLNIQELSSFPLDDFFDHYERGLRKLVSSFQLEAQNKHNEAEQAKTKLTEVRKNIAKLLKSMNDEFDLDPECVTEQVDELLEACVKQASASDSVIAT